MVVNCVRLPIACIDTAWRRLLLTGEWRPLIDCSTMYSSLEQVSSSSTVDVHRVAGCCVCSTTVWSAWSECWNDSRQSSDTYFENSHFTNLKNFKKFANFYEVLTLLTFWQIKVLHFYAPRLYRQALLWRVLAMAIMSVCLSGVPRPGTESSPGKIETPGFHHMIA